MTFQETIEFSTQTIREVFEHAGISVVNIILFGSRFRGDVGPDSDWDYLVCTKNEISFPKKATLASVVQTKLAEKHISADIIIRSEKQIADERGNVGVITYYALKDSVPV
jgi:uncharacterized protein